MNLAQLFFTLFPKKQFDSISSITAPQTNALSLFCYHLYNETAKPQVIITESFDRFASLESDLKTIFSKEDIHLYPHLETLPYDTVFADKETIGLRIDALDNIKKKKTKFLITTLQAVLQMLPPINCEEQDGLSLQSGQIIKRSIFFDYFQKHGYLRVEQVEMKGEFAVRGELIDIFPLNQSHPLRVRFFDDEIESIRVFDINTQNSLKTIDRIEILPAREHAGLFSDSAKLENILREQKAQFSKEHYEEITLALKEHNFIEPDEKYLPYLSENHSSIIDYFSESPHIIFCDFEQTASDYVQFEAELQKEFELSLEQETLTPTIDSLYFRFDAFLERHADLKQWRLGSADDLPEVTDQHQIKSLKHLKAETSLLQIEQDQNKHPLILLLENWLKKKVAIFISASSQTNFVKIKQLLDHWQIQFHSEESLNSIESLWNKEWSDRPFLFYFPYSAGFQYFDQAQSLNFAWITESDIFEKTAKKKKEQAMNYGSMIRSLEQLNIDDYIVHMEYGIGQYKGLETIQINNTKHDYMLIHYKNDDKIYLPVDRLHLVQRYASAQKEFVPINKIGDKRWQQTKSRVQKEIEDITEELIELYAKRKVEQGIQLSEDTQEYINFKNLFPHQLTEDQEKAMMDIENDMHSSRIMDRLICGDVGFGKTELAMCAACKTILDGYQVGILAPTTLLAQQHYFSFKQRFREVAANIEMVSRLKSNNEIKPILKNLFDDKVDILIGTHRLLSDDVVFKNLGLLIVDEEQRFGVKQKEKIKKKFQNIETLSLSATPIPRTLQMSLSGFRDISVINTPPINRRVIRTRVMAFNDFVIKEAVEREARRKGQVYFLHNRVESIIEVKEYLSRLLPNIQIVIAHGKMEKKMLENIMIDFIQNKFTVLLSTTIIESGLDIANVNTIIINNAHSLGLAQLYQLRGRVGRSEKQAYAYLLYPKQIKIKKDAKARLKILQDITDLASGFKIAAHDLELRGTGNLLGTKQSGNINEVGYELYLSLIEEAIDRLKNNEQQTSDIKQKEIQIQLPFEVYLPDDFIASPKLRLQVYKDIIVCKDEAMLFELQKSIEDRFGTLPETAINLFKQMQLRILARQIHAEQIELNAKHNLIMSFSETFKPDINQFFQFITQQNAQFISDKSIQFNKEFMSLDQTISQITLMKQQFFPEQHSMIER